MVFSTHFFMPVINFFDVHEGYFKSILKQFLANGTAGVYMFFVLSGFLITYLLLKEKEKTGTINVLFFYARRALRIWPLYYAIVLFAVFIYPVIKGYFNANASLNYDPIYYFFFLGNFDVIHIERFYNGVMPGFLEVTWSVSIEEQFYLIWPLLFIIVPKKHYVYIFYSIIIISLGFQYYCDLNNFHFNGRHTLSVLYLLSMGGLTAYYVMYSKKFMEVGRELPRSLIVLIYIIGVFLFLSKSILGNEKEINHIFLSLLLALFFAFVIFDQNFCRNSFFKFSSNAFITKWGKYTYGLYMLHNIAGIMVFGIGKLLRIDSSGVLVSFLFGLMTLLLSFLLSYLSYHLFEKRFLEWKKKMEVVKQ